MAASQHEICQWVVAAAPGGRLVSDSRQVEPGDVFFAYPGETADGRRFIASAVSNGAVAVVYEERDFEWDDAVAIPHLAVPELKAQAGLIAHACPGQPDADMFTVAVTGTHAKTSRAAREMEAASRLRHERCVRAYDFGGDSGHVYIAYEYVQGSTLRENLGLPIPQSRYVADRRERAS